MFHEKENNVNNQSNVGLHSTCINKVRRLNIHEKFTEFDPDSHEEEAI